MECEGHLYLTPSITWIFNMNDNSFSLSPEILYIGVKDLDLRLKASVLKVEIRMRYYF